MESSSTSPSGVTRSCTLGLRSSAPTMRSSTIPPSCASWARYQSSRVSTCSKAIASSRRPSSARSSGRARRGQVTQVDDRVAAAGDAVVELDDRARDGRPGRPHPRQRVDDALRVVQVLVAERVLNAGLGEQPPASGLGAEGQVHRIGAVERDAQRQREVALELGGRVRHEMAARRVRDQRADLRQHTRALEQLLRQRARGAVVRGHHVQAAARLPGDDARQQPEVVLDDALGHRAAGHVDHAQPRLAQQEQQEQHALLERLQDGSGLRRVGRDGRYDDDRLARLVESHRRPQRHEPLLEPGEARAALVLAQVAQPRRGFGEPGHAFARASSSPTTL